ncbi:hypothetical protein SEPCBS119000_000944 [Sporothrix epigloea]|uniref:Uncharacterized protein n=1 Tax=Sporothrix epigloea TaxID=1892477 RepID=A0ABP0D801_9PEZI
MSDTPVTAGKQPPRRFAPVPIETTFLRYRKGDPQINVVVPAVPTAELTPSPSPQSDLPPPTLWTLDPIRLPLRAKMEKRHFAPQLIESSRRSRRAGDVGPATKPTDKTDITPYHHHIYAPKTRKRHRKVQSLARRESCEDETAGHVFEMLAREAEKQMLEEAALAAYPNSRARAGGAEHFVIRESSDDDSSGSYSRSREKTIPRVSKTSSHARRDSQSEDVGWAFRAMQEHHELLDKARAASVTPASPDIASGKETTATSATAVPTPDMSAMSPPRPIQLDRISTIDLDQMSMESPPNDPIWTTTARQVTLDSAIQPIGESFMPYILEENIDLPGLDDGYRGIPSYAQKPREVEDDLVDIPGHFLQKDAKDLVSEAPPATGEASSSAAPVSSIDVVTKTESAAQTSNTAQPIPAETGFHGRNVYAGYRNREIFASERDLQQLRKRSPPMLGKELEFAQCASPKHTKVEAEQSWTINDRVEETRQDDNGQHGLWHGLCFSNKKNQAMVPIERPALLETPFALDVQEDAFAHAFSLSIPGTVYAEPMHADGTASATTASAAAAATVADHGSNNIHSHGFGLSHNYQEPKGLHMLAGLDERLRQEKAAAELEESIMAEFTDRFVTQVYNYLSLGYPSMAWFYDDELSKISHITVDELEQDDASTSADSLGPGSFSTGGSRGGSGSGSSSSNYSPGAKGHISLDEDDENGAGYYNHDSCPRWRALKLYIYEWARQHPDLNAISPLAWGMRERRGSWGV